MTDEPETPDVDFDVTLDFLQRAKTGDDEALGALLERYSGRILDIVRIRLGAKLRHSLESRDILQETLNDAFRDFDRYEIREDAHFVHWLAKIAEHRIASRVEYFSAQKRDVNRRVSFDNADPVGRESFQVESDSPTPSVELVRNEERALVADCIRELPPRYAEVITLRNYIGHSWDEVARQTEHASAGAARMTHSRAQIALGKLLRARGLG